MNAQDLLKQLAKELGLEAQALEEALAAKIRKARADKALQAAQKVVRVSAKTVQKVFAGNPDLQELTITFYREDREPTVRVRLTGQTGNSRSAKAGKPPEEWPEGVRVRLPDRGPAILIHPDGREESRPLREVGRMLGWNSQFNRGQLRKRLRNAGLLIES